MGLFAVGWRILLAKEKPAGRETAERDRPKLSYPPWFKFYGDSAGRLKARLEEGVLCFIAGRSHEGRGRTKKGRKRGGCFVFRDGDPAGVKGTSPRNESKVVGAASPHETHPSTGGSTSA